MIYKCIVQSSVTRSSTGENLLPLSVCGVNYRLLEVQLEASQWAAVDYNQLLAMAIRLLLSQYKLVQPLPRIEPATFPHVATQGVDVL